MASGSSGNCYHIDDGSTALLLECGVKYKDVQKALNYNTTDIQGVLVTHEHNDHIKYAKEFLERGQELYMTKGTKEAKGLDHFRINTIKYKEVFKIGTFKIVAFESMHDVEEPCSFLIESKHGHKILFATDTYYIKYRFNGITHMLLEVNHDYELMMHNVERGYINNALARRIMKSHLNLDNAIKFLKACDLSKLQEIHLIHLSSDNSKAQEFKRKIQEVTGVKVIIAGGKDK
ncbi:MBL fold metallo-hydrolase [Abyssicoccus albus]|uniref:MBL fold metallo-hydrolase n=1 Tax=Abyssicoccus albus TaxID=1817405 RepID=UPI0039EE5E4E